MSGKKIYMAPSVLVLSVALVGTAKADLVGRCRFDAGSGTTAYDSSGNSNDGTFVSPPPVADFNRVPV